MSATVSTMTVTVITVIGGGGIVLTLSLIAILIGKECISTSENPRTRVLARSLDLAIVPLLIGFVSIVIIRIVEHLR